MLPLVEAVSQDLGRVLLNLLTNAFYAVRQRQQLGEPVRSSSARYLHPKPWQTKTTLGVGGVTGNPS